MVGRIPDPNPSKIYHVTSAEGKVQGAKQTVRFTATFDRAPQGFFERVWALVFNALFNTAYTRRVTETFTHEVATDITDRDPILIDKIRSAYYSAENIEIQSVSPLSSALERGELGEIPVSSQEVDAFMQAIGSSEKLSTLYTENDRSFIRSHVAVRLIQAEKYLAYRHSLDPSKDHEMTSKNVSTYLHELEVLARGLPDPSYLKNPAFGTFVPAQKRHFHYKVKMTKDGSVIFSLPTIRVAGGFKNFSLVILKDQKNYQVAGKLSMQEVLNPDSMSLAQELAYSGSYSGQKIVKKELTKGHKTQAYVVVCKPLADVCSYDATISFSDLEQAKKDLKDKCKVICDAAVQLKKMHEDGKVHCDIKPDNILIAQDPEDPSKISGVLWDFGLLKDNGSFSRSGTEGYYLRTETTATYSRDYYALGKTILDMLVINYPTADPLEGALFKEAIQKTVEPIVDDLMKTKQRVVGFSSVTEYDSDGLDLSDIKSRLETAFSDAAIQAKIDAISRDPLVVLRTLSNPDDHDYKTTDLKRVIRSVFERTIFKSTDVATISTLRDLNTKIISSLRQVHYEQLPEEAKDNLQMVVTDRIRAFATTYDWSDNLSALKNAVNIEGFQANVSRWKADIGYDGMHDDLKSVIDEKIRLTLANFIVEEILDPFAISDIDALSQAELMLKKNEFIRIRASFGNVSINPTIDRLLRDIDVVLKRKEMIAQFQDRTIDPIIRLQIAENMQQDLHFSEDIKRDAKDYIREFKSNLTDVDHPRFGGLFRQRRTIDNAESGDLYDAVDRRPDLDLYEKIRNDILPYRRGTTLLKQYLEPNPIQYIVVDNRKAFVKKRDGTNRLIEW